jgi:protoporphyrinogen oxidase
MPSQGPDRQKVAVIGSGMAGLVTAYLLRTDASRFEVELFERVSSSSTISQWNNLN